MKTDLKTILNEGDILIIVPPFASREFAILGPHVLQSVANNAGYKADVLYLNIVFASIVGHNLYDRISTLPYNLRWMKLGERLFARSAHNLPPLGGYDKTDGSDAVCFLENNPPFSGMPLESLNLSVANLLEMEEACRSFSVEASQEIAQLNYRIVGCTTQLEQTNCCVALLNGIKQHRPDIITIIGGTNCDGEMAEGVASLSQSIDFVFSGESESSLTYFLKDHSKGKLPDGRIVIGEPLKDPDTLDLPDYEDYFRQTEHFSGKNPPKMRVISYETSRGCWWGQKRRCTFCGNNDDKSVVFRQKSADKVKKDLEILAANYPVNGIMMTDNIVPPGYYRKIFPFLSEKKEFPSVWYQENSGLTLGNLISLRKARFGSVLAGIEALSDGLLKLMNKRSNAGQNLMLLRNARSVGMYVSWHMLWGVPGDKSAYYKETLKLIPLIRHLQPPRELLRLILVRQGSYVRNTNRHHVTNLRHPEVYDHIYPDWAEKEKLAYEFDGDYPSEAHENPELIRQLDAEISAWKASWKNASLFMTPFDEYFAIHDVRGIGGENENHILDYGQAREIMRYGDYTESKFQTWALEKKLGVVAGTRYVPLVTASPDLLLEFRDR